MRSHGIVLRLRWFCLDIDASAVGLAITQSISLTGIFQWGMRQSAEMENQMTSVERVLEYTNLTQEAALRAVNIFPYLVEVPTSSGFR
jgi:uncharacterized protein (DUF885 family)